VFFAHEPLTGGALVALGEDAAHHARVRRLEVGEPVALRDGAGGTGVGRLARLARSHAAVELHAVVHVPLPPPVHMLVPVGDRDRMLWLAEKCVELGATSWRPVLWRRSRSVGPRGEGSAFHQKVRARMIAALTQCGGAWLPELHPDAPVERAAAAAPDGTRVVLDPGGAPMLALEPAGSVSVAVGPEGGIEPDELAHLEAAGFRRARLPGSTLRFETAGIAGLALARALVERREPH
jgi:16S rRNA (uracil1498-N3)-methyltransferase